MRVSFAQRVAGVALAAFAVSVAACSSATASAGVPHTWQYQELSLSYPSSLTPGTLNVAYGSPNSSCLCHLVAPVSGDLLEEVHSGTFLFRGQKNSGLAISVIDIAHTTADSPLNGDALTPGAVESLASQLQLPAGPDLVSQQAESQPETIAGLPSAHLAPVAISSSVMPNGLQQDWIVLNARLRRIYLITCQYPRNHADAITQACQAIVSSLKVAG